MSSQAMLIGEYPLSFLRKLNTLLLQEERPKLMAIDGTGIDSWQRSRHYERRIGEAQMPSLK